MKKIKITNNPFVLFLPFLIFYIILIILKKGDGLTGDEGRYLLYSRYMIDGFLPTTEIDFDYLGNGPGYSILILPFVKLNLHFFWIKILNAFLLYFSIILLFNTAIKILTFRGSLFVAIFWACFINSYENIIRVLPEVFASFLISAIVFSLINVFKAERPKRHVFFTGFLLGYLALTKPIFGYVITCMLIASCILWLFKNRKKSYKLSVIVLAIAMATAIPYLIYTYKVTGRVFYWSTLGGNNLYWATEPDRDEYGSWSPNPELPLDSVSLHTHIIGFEEQLRVKHQSDFEKINKFRGVKQDSIYMELALKNIKTYPFKFVENCVSNLGRIFFNLPYSYKLQSPRTLSRFPFTGTMLVLMLFCFVPTIRNWQKIDFPVKFLIFFAFIYLGGSLFGSAETRMFTVITPALLISIGYIFERSYKMKIRF